jgi:hypothetical protein
MNSRCLDFLIRSSYKLELILLVFATQEALLLSLVFMPIILSIEINLLSYCLNLAYKIVKNVLIFFIRAQFTHYKTFYHNCYCQKCFVEAGVHCQLP